jgi:hypothetical protein
VFECDYAEVSRIVEKTEDNCRQIDSFRSSNILQQFRRLLVFQLTKDGRGVFLTVNAGNRANGAYNLVATVSIRCGSD